MRSIDHNSHLSFLSSKPNYSPDSERLSNALQSSISLPEIIPSSRNQHCCERFGNFLSILSKRGQMANENKSGPSGLTYIIILYYITLILLYYIIIITYIILGIKTSVEPRRWLRFTELNAFLNQFGVCQHFLLSSFFQRLFLWHSLCSRHLPWQQLPTALHQATQPPRWLVLLQCTCEQGAD